MPAAAAYGRSSTRH